MEANCTPHYLGVGFQVPTDDSVLMEGGGQLWIDFLEWGVSDTDVDGHIAIFGRQELVCRCRYWKKR
jgi:hypothetical protein